MAYDFERGPTAHIHHQIMREVDRARLQAFAFITHSLLDLKLNRHVNAVTTRPSRMFTSTPASICSMTESCLDFDSMMSMFIQDVAFDTHLKFQNTLRFLSTLRAASPDSEYVLCMKYSFQDRS